ncbi:MAG: hypothetical protein A3D44_02500 [Candidatus Staskawiczbacteria bacterium RIFCSPHIGHO2_02_FULL_42_22]|uniref:Tryptophan synthase beta chain-like PALP domain-containing protein n=1 Tax=Candidatus Staskawiczbacteria bacterium RIFCSPHIGHO2_02_FULL_42_22 TaxID=1802207 RepID=A0A1G2HZL8_9BACT|nr:MAG: hypothetical protein A3D44_02500 [Candidatus Staskawiczbacteria bacterium RIFCSPHIGHO2_02_FULL_42_22]
MKGALDNGRCFLSFDKRRFCMNPYMKNPTVFCGEKSVRDFLNPANYPAPPLVEVSGLWNFCKENGIQVHASCPSFQNGTIKLLAAYNMLQEAENAGMLDEIKGLVESTSGNMGCALGRIGKHFGIKTVKVIVPSDVAPGRLEALRMAGVEIEFVKSGAIARAKEYAQKGYLHLNQYGNKHNPEAVKKWLAPRIWGQTRGKITVFCSAMGTCGTMIGTSDFLKAKNKKIAILGIHLEKDEAVPGIRTLARLAEVSLPWERHVDYLVGVKAKESYKNSVMLCRAAGLDAGPSSGSAASGLMAWLYKTWKSNELDNFRNENGLVVAVFVCPDGPQAYIDKYSTFLDPMDF